MKGIGKILLYAFFVLGMIGLIWVIFSPGAAGSEVDFEAWMGNPLTSYIIFVAIIAIVITVIAFLIYKVVDLMKHPSHLREALYVLGAIVVALIIGFIFGGSEEIANADNLSFAGMKSRMIGTGIVMALALLFVGFAFLAWDTIKGIIKG